MNPEDWYKIAPSWAVWLSKDGNGSQCIFSHFPDADEDRLVWELREGECADLPFFGPADGVMRLERRP